MTLFITFLFTGLGLAMDAFAVSVAKGLTMKKLNLYQACIIGLFFGVFQAVMPYIGWLLGAQFEQYLQNFDHWIAFVLLAFIGGKMLFEAIREKDDETGERSGYKLDIKELLVLAVATSIDALAVGVTFAFLGEEYNIYEAISVIGVTTFLVSVLGVVIGFFVGSKYKKKAEIAGGAILVLIGLKILLEHLGVIAF